MELGFFEAVGEGSKFKGKYGYFDLGGDYVRGTEFPPNHRLTRLSRREGGGTSIETRESTRGEASPIHRAAPARMYRSSTPDPAANGQV